MTSTALPSKPHQKKTRLEILTLAVGRLTDLRRSHQGLIRGLILKYHISTCCIRGLQEIWQNGWMRAPQESTRYPTVEELRCSMKTGLPNTHTQKKKKKKQRPCLIVGAFKWVRISALSSHDGHSRRATKQAEKCAILTRSTANHKP